MLFNEPKLLKSSARPRPPAQRTRFSALQRAEIAEIRRIDDGQRRHDRVSVLFNEPKLLKFGTETAHTMRSSLCFSALQRAEIAEIDLRQRRRRAGIGFQCSSTSRNC